MKKQIVHKARQTLSSIPPAQETLPAYYLELHQRHTTEWSTMVANQTNTWALLEDGLLADYSQVCASQGGLVKEVAILRGHLQKLILLDQQHQQEKARLSVDQVQEKAALKVCYEKSTQRW